MATDTGALLRHELGLGGGILRLDPAWVARSFLPGGRRLGLPDDAYDLGERGSVCERWLASTTHADNAVGPEDEGLSYVRTADGEPLLLAAAVAAEPELVMGAAYAATHDGLGRLAKIFDYGARIPFHIHPPAEQAAKVGRNSKDEAYYFPPGIDLGQHPESFFGLHPSADPERTGAALVEELRRWDGDGILQHSRANRQVAEDGYFIPSGVLHAPGTALTVELQEESDAMAMFQALNAGRIIDKELLFKDVCYDDRCTLGEAALLQWIDWEANTDPYFYENRRTEPRPFRRTESTTESWIFYGSPKFSGKRLVVSAGGSDVSRERGVFSLLVLQGEGTIGGHPVVGGVPGQDELLVTHDAAVSDLEVSSTGDTDLLVIKVFGPDLNPDSPTVTPYRPR